jgi:hypothetical protein
MSTSPSALRRVYLAGAERATRLVANSAVDVAWEQPSVIAPMTVGALAAHLARSVLQVEWFLDAEAPGSREPLSSTRYYGRIADSQDLGSALNVGVRARSSETAATGWSTVSADCRAALARLTGRLVAEPADRRVPILHRPGEEMLLDEYLRTRCVEIAVHVEDLALSVGTDPALPREVAAVAVDVLVAAARDRHGDVEVLRALARRERDTLDALRVL